MEKEVKSGSQAESEQHYASQVHSTVWVLVVGIWKDTNLMIRVYMNSSSVLSVTASPCCQSYYMDNLRNRYTSAQVKSTMIARLACSAGPCQ